MSRVPFFLDRARFGYRLGNAELVDAMYRDGFLCPLSKLVMGETAEVLADRYEINEAFAAQVLACDRELQLARVLTQKIKPASRQALPNTLPKWVDAS